MHVGLSGLDKGGQFNLMGIVKIRRLSVAAIKNIK